MLLNDFFKITSIQKNPGEQGKVTVVCELNDRHHIFDGHFPEIPVVPGVCQLQMINEILGQIIGGEMMIRKGNNIKHTGIINPQINKTLHFVIAYEMQEDQSFKVNCNIVADEYTFLKFSGVLESI